ncbi:leucine-zipper-like transcriptional regulator 1 isoform X2 [Plutella xylostella]|uniref:leucine-zipper-like transcriptional regulator 1 isoform X1 n=1 Tax=Plutella xylostella TaxID=51655 RepID=UPI0020323EF1|nr:leucine-zipper-like transcriptional regulator 1 isoform X1 [Plutella xylostella]XP_048482354.1 leucine-zipper-like transcriptional regulator 1 isoform X2 [Plutella xylostella]
MQHPNKIITEQLRNPSELDINLKMEFGPFEPVHKWKRLSECYEFVGARRSKHTAVAYKDAIYVFGGDNGKSMLNDLIRFDIKEKSWTRTGCMGTPPAPRYHHSAVVYKSSMFVFGGYTGDILANSNLTNKNDLFEYKFHSAQWVQWKFTGQEPVPRSAHGAAVYDDKLWIFAGYDGNARLNDMWTVNLTGEKVVSWEKVPAQGRSPPTCCNFPVAVARGSMFVFSGQSGAKITNALFHFHFESRTWTRVCTEHLLRCAGPAPARRYGHVMLAHGRHLYVFGGAADNTLPNDLHCYDLDTQMWSVVQPAPESCVPVGRLFHAGAVVGDAMYIFGGTVDNNVRSGELFRFQLSDYPRCTLHDDFGGILRSQQFCDVTLLLGSAEAPAPAHQALLAARSHYLRDKILEAREEQAKRIASGEETPQPYCAGAPPSIVVKLPEATPEAFKMVLNYIYTDRIDPTEKDENPASPATVLLVMEVLRLALRLNIPRLRCLCARFLKANLCYSNVLPALHAAHHAQLHCIKEYCLRFVVKDYNFTPIVMSAEFENMERGLMVELIRRRQQPPPKHPPHDPDVEIQGTTLEQDMAVLASSLGGDATGVGALSDVTLCVGGARRAAHRSVLAARATYFEAMFRSFSPPDNIVNIQICDTVPSEEAFDSLLRYIYYGDTNMPTEDSLYLFQAPIYYGFTNNRLQVFCAHNLQSNVSAENVLAIFEAADRMRAPDIKQYALEMIVHNFAQVARQEAMRHLAQPLLVDIVTSLADEARYESPLPLAPRALPPSASADALADEDRRGKT